MNLSTCVFVICIINIIIGHKAPPYVMCRPLGPYKIYVLLFPIYLDWTEGDYTLSRVLDMAIKKQNKTLKIPLNGELSLLWRFYCY